MGDLLRRRVVLLALAASLSPTAGAAERAPPWLRLPHVLVPPIALPVLLYHRIGPLNGSLPAITRHLTVSPADFAAQMEWLTRHGYHAVTEEQTFDALEYGARLPAKPVMITFDDGYRDVLWHAAPVLHRLHMPATEFVITSRISGPDSSFLTWPELIRLERLGIEIGSHTVTHADLSALPAADAFRELRDSRRVLEEHLHRIVRSLAYPYGKTSAAVVALARKAGYVLAMTTEPGTRQSARKPLLLRRVEILDSTGATGLAAALG